MLQQTPVMRVLPAFRAWLARWPDPAALAATSSGEAVRQWGRLGYPRRARNLHACAVAIVQRHGGEVPDAYDDLLALPGVGRYTAAAVASFAFGQRHPVVDTNVRRVLSRVVVGEDRPAAAPASAAADRRLAGPLVPAEPARAARWAAAVMELGALVCTARAPRCGHCPIPAACRWRNSGHPPYEGPVRPAQGYAGTDRQARGDILALLRAAHGPLALAQLLAGDPPPGSAGRADAGRAVTAGLGARAGTSSESRRRRALKSLIADGLVESVGDQIGLVGDPLLQEVRDRLTGG